MDRPDDTAEVPPDVRATLEGLFGAAADAVRAGEVETALATVGTAATVCRNKLPAGDRRDRLLHGCEAVRRTLEADPSPAVAIEYLEGLRGRL